jgi:hypothetical protein
LGQWLSRPCPDHAVLPVKRVVHALLQAENKTFNTGPSRWSSRRVSAFEAGDSSSILDWHKNFVCDQHDTLVFD